MQYFCTLIPPAKNKPFNKPSGFSLWLYKLELSYFSIVQAWNQMLMHHWIYLVTRVDHHYLQHITSEHPSTTWLNSHPTLIGQRKKRKSSELLLHLQFREWWELSACKLDNLKKMSLWAFWLVFPPAGSLLLSAQHNRPLNMLGWM